jgi:hypothetical protein
MRKPIPPFLTFSQALSRGYVERMEDRAYMDWVKQLKCVSCHAPADDPHHPYGTQYKGMGTKVPDYWVIPVCRNCHDALHHNVAGWEEANGTQYQHALLTLTQALYEGVIRAT